MESKRRRTFSFSSPQLNDESSSPSLPILNNLSTNLLNSNILDSSNEINTTTPRGAASPAKKVFTLGDQNASNSSLHINYTSHASLSNAASVNVWSLLKGDLYASEYETSQDLKRERVYNFIHVPEEMEKMMVFGFFICLDAFLTMLTIFPMRVCLACFNFLKCFLKENGNLRLVSPIHICDLLKALIIGIVCFLLTFMDSSILYHSIRGQAVIKLYVIFNVLEIFDRMCCSFGQDILDSFLSSSIRKSDSDQIATDGGGSLNSRFLSKTQLKPFTHFILSITYVFVHSIILFYQAITLNVAINSYNNSLLTLLVSNQFVEIKSAVFKKFEKENLFQLACSDIVERFQLFVYLLVIAVRNLIERGSGGITLEYLFGSLFVEISMVFICELLVDWLKHAFITKFNLIRPSIYSKFIDVLCKDMVRKDDEHLADHSMTISRRIGFSVMPLLCFTLRIFGQTVTMLDLGAYLPIVILGFFTAAFVLKLQIGLYIIRYSLYRCKNMEKAKEENYQQAHGSSFNISANTRNSVKPATVATTLENIDRFTLFKSRVP